MMQRMICFALVAMAGGHFAVSGYAQGGALSERAAAAAQAATQAQIQQRAQAQVQQRAQAQVQQRAQAQVQQRAQAQVQQRAQAQLQQRAQAQVQQRASGQLGSSLRGAARSSAAAAGRMTPRQGQAGRLGVDAGANVRTDANAAGTRFTTDSRVRVNGSGRLVVPGPALLGNGEVNVKYFDNVFGRHNPFRQAEAGPSPQPSSPSSQPSASENRSASQQRVAGRGAAQQGVLNAQVDLSKAVRLRRSEISAVRDHALTTGNAQLMASADQMEQILNRFMEAQAAAEAQARATAGGAANEQGMLQAGLNASATGQARGRIGGDGTRVAQRSEGLLTAEGAAIAEGNTFAEGNASNSVVPAPAPATEE